MDAVADPTLLGEILILEPFYGGSHRQLIDLLKTAIPQHTLLTLPASKWHWRARTSALHFAFQIPSKHTFRVLFSSSVLNLAELVALRPDLSGARKILYFHENQLVYPVRKQQDRDFQYGYNQILSCLIADVIAFNSNYNLESFLSSIESFLKLMPNRPKHLAAKIRPKCSVLYFPLNFSLDLPHTVSGRQSNTTPGSTPAQDSDDISKDTSAELMTLSRDLPLRTNQEHEFLIANSQDFNCVAIQENYTKKNTCVSDQRSCLKPSAHDKSNDGSDGQVLDSGTHKVNYTKVNRTVEMYCERESTSNVSGGISTCCEDPKESEIDTHGVESESCKLSVHHDDTRENSGVSNEHSEEPTHATGGYATEHYSCSRKMDEGRLEQCVLAGESEGGTRPDLEKQRVRKPIHILWPHRWEHDKNPDEFFSTLFQLHDQGFQFKLSVLGENYLEIPSIFNEAKLRLHDAILHWGYLPSKDQYFEVLSQADVVVSTANHEFFGVAMLEAASYGCYPLCPDRLVYPEIFPVQYLYRTPKQLFKKLRRFCKYPHLARDHTFEGDLSLYSWEKLKNDYVDLFDLGCGGPS